MTNSVKQQSGKRTNYRWFVALLFFIIYTIAAADRANLGVALPFIRKDFDMTNAEAGGLVSLFLIAYALIQLPSAWLLSKFGVRKVFPISMILTSIATGLTGTVNSLFALKMCRLTLGLAEGPLPIGVTTTINNWFPSKEKGTASGIFLSAVKFGPVVTPILGAVIISIWGWKEVFIFFAVPGIILSAFWYMLVQNKPSESRFTNQQEVDYIAENENGGNQAKGVTASVEMPLLDKIIRVKEVEQLNTNKDIFKSWNIIGCSLGYCFQLGISSLLLAWIPTYLLVVKNFSIIGMGIVAAAPWVGAVVGNLFGGFLSDRILGRRRKPGMMISSIATAGMMFVLINAPAEPTIFGLLLFLTGVLLNIGFSAYMVYPMSFTAKDKFPTANAIVNMGGQLGGAATPFIAGLLLDSYGWNSVFTFMSIISCLTFIIVLTIAEPLKTVAKK
ncbi:MFS transporter [Zophobihabitans entericus]|uniref:MFS transporter n=1 Tax=Zophobihabitans entericus TaxID=1635327 RepID=A0A6G9ID52_9GAMM|nr:MFS transporter [Zophobihabitans entericus]QIQ21634.1 MFS transporter [Zophobihabitans entericus]